MRGIINKISVHYFEIFIFFKPVLNDSYNNDDDFLVVMLLMGAIFFTLTLILGIVLSFVFIILLVGLISVGLLSTSVLFGLYQQSISKGFKFLFISASIFCCTLVSVLFFWFVNSLKEWWSGTNSIIIGLFSGIVLGYFIGVLLFITIKKMIEFLRNRYEK